MHGLIVLERSSVRRFRLVTATVSLAVGALLTGCTQGTPAPTETIAPTETTAVEIPTFVPDGGAEANKPFFDYTLEQLIAANPKPDRKTMVDTLVNAGFDKSRMEVTADETAIGLEVDFMIVAVKMPDDQCLLGQWGARGYSSEMAAPTDSGQCLMGKPEPIDW